MTRRKFFYATLATLTGSAITGWALRPDNKGKRYNSYFFQLNQLLQQQGIAKPTLVIDKQKLIQNCKTFKQQFVKNRSLRLVVKSLPSVELLKILSENLQTNHFMVFHQPFINHIVKAFPDADLLLGKPMPVHACELFYQTLQMDQQHQKTIFEPKKQLQWLIDSQQRLEQYLEVAKKLSQKMRICIEIDVGLHRGGISSPNLLDELMITIRQNPDYLQFSGFMGYDAHVGKLPSVIETLEESLANSQAIYQSFIDYSKQHFHDLIPENVCYNGAGSPTILLHQDNSPLNELSAGSCFVKPSNFDLPSLAKMQPASYIATPVLKIIKGLHLPSANWLSQLWQQYDINRRYTFFIYGGKWLAEPISPEGLSHNVLYGSSTNQDMLNASSDLGLQTDDLIFFRPEQSEAVFLQFGKIALVDHDNQQVDWLDILSQQCESD